MKIKKSKAKSTKFKVIVVVTIVLILCVAGFFALKTFGLFDIKTQTSNKEAEEKLEQTKSELAIKEQSVQSVQDESKPNPQSDQPNTSNNQDLGVTITSPNVQNINNFKIRGYIDRATTTGTCTLTLTAQNKKTVVKSVQGLQPSNQISGCPDITVSSSEISPGVWLATLTYEDTGYKGQATQEITVN